MADLDLALTELHDGLEKSNTTLSGILGIALGGRIVNHPTRNGYVYVRLRDNLSEVVVAFNDKVSPVYGLPVVVEFTNNRWYITGRDTTRYSDWGTSAPFLPQHGDQHSFNRIDNVGGGDIVWVYSDQIMPMLGYPSGTAGARNILIANAMIRKNDGSFLYVGGSGTIDLVQYKPTNNQAILALVYVDKSTGNFGYLIGSGTPFSGLITGTAALTQYIPTIPSSNFIGASVVRLVSGTVSIGWANLYDIRQFTGGAGGGSASITGTIGSLDPNRVVISDASGAITTSPKLTYDDSVSVLVLGSGTPPAVGNNTFHQLSDGASNAHLMWTWGAGFAPFMGGVASRGSMASPSAIQKDDVLFRVRGRAYDGSQYGNTEVEIRLISNENQNVAGHGSRLEIYLTVTGSTALVKWAEFNPSFGMNITSGTYNIGGVPHTHASSGGGAAFQRNLAANLTLADGESLVIIDYLNSQTFDLQMDGDSALQIL